MAIQKYIDGVLNVYNPINEEEETELLTKGWRREGEEPAEEAEKLEQEESGQEQETEASNSSDVVEEVSGEEEIEPESETPPVLEIHESKEQDGVLLDVDVSVSADETDEAGEAVG